LAMMDPGAMPPASETPPKRKPDEQTVEIFVDQVQRKPAGGVDSAQLVSDNGEYDKTLPLSAVSAKGQLLVLKCEKGLPKKIYSLYWTVAGTKIPFWKHLPFEQIRVHSPKTERTTAKAADEDEDEDQDQDEDSDESGAEAA